MGHTIQGFLGKSETIKEIVSPLSTGQYAVIELPQNIHCLFLSCGAWDIIAERQNVTLNNNITPFDFLDTATKEYLQNIKPSGKFIYIETDYYGGRGSQAAGIFEDGILLDVYNSEGKTDGAINTALRFIGVIKEPDADEFETLNLHKYRHMPDFN